jgi:hypothetical protein
MPTIQERILIISTTILHVFFCFFHYNNVNGKNLDADHFYNTALTADSWFETFGLGTKFMSFISYPLIKLGCNQLSLFILFSVISFSGFILFLKLLNVSVVRKGFLPVYFFIFLLPSLHFWGGSYSKEALIFPLMIFLLYKIKEKKYKEPLLYIVLLLILFIRPYLFFIVIGAFTVTLFTEKEKLKTKFLFLGIIVFILVLMTPILINFLKITSIGSIYKNYRDIAVYASEAGNSSINLLESNYFERLSLVLFRPLFYDATTFYQYYISVENLLVLSTVIYLVCRVRKGSLKKEMFLVKFSLITSLFVILFLSIYMYNLGLASRMRVMFIPYLFYGLLKVKVNKP